MNEIRYQQALALAVAAHKEQVRKTDGSPYVVHPIMVARIVEQYSGREEAVVAALVHDVLEDTNVREAELRTQLGHEVVDIVTAVSEDKELPWRERKQRYIDQVAASSESVKLVSVADKIHNADSLIAYHALHGAATWAKFSKGKADKVWFERSLLEALQHTWEHPLLSTYAKRVEQLESLEA